MNERDESFTMERFGRLKEMDRSFDLEYWRRLGPDAVLEEGWRMVEEYLRAQGREDELRLDRSVESFQRRRG